MVQYLFATVVSSGSNHERHKPMEHSTENTPSVAVEQTKKRSGFKRSLMYLLVIGVLGGSGYIAYEQGALDQYLPVAMKAKQETVVSAPTAVADNPTTATPNAAAPATTVTPNPVINDATTPSSVAPVTTVAPAESGVAANATNTTSTPTPTVNNLTPITLSINSAQGNALLMAVDAQWQWQAAQQNFKQRWDGAALLQQIQSLKVQLQASRDANFAPALAALTQAETQVQAWQSTQSVSYLTALQQAIVAADSIQLRTKVSKPAAAVDSAPATGFWASLMASLKDVIVVEKVDASSEKVLDESTAALIKQSVHARLLLAQLAAQSGQWPQAQTHAKAANDLLTQWGDGSSQSVLSGLKPLIEQTTWATVPDLNVVTLALQQTRAAMSAQAIGAAQNPTPYTTPAAPNTPDGQSGVKGGV